LKEYFTRKFQLLSDTISRDVAINAYIHPLPCNCFQNFGARPEVLPPKPYHDQFLRNSTKTLADSLRSIATSAKEIDSQRNSQRDIGFILSETICSQ